MPDWTFRALATADTRTLEGVLADNPAPDLDAVIGWEFRGWNVLAPHAKFVMHALGNLRFIKAFRRRESQLEGYNLKVERGGLDAPWRCRPNDRHPESQGFYDVHPPGESDRATHHPHALFLDYDRAENNLFSGRYLRDYLVRANPEDDRLLVGRAYMKLGPVQQGGFFILERLQPCRPIRG